ncbi:MAG: hypothetical protein HON53_21010 [Planctomycetaceae bacterium]|jgi:hypothetical protein|nr:hypothetical protein [Planctomycetaceae bacterium]MBT6154095.1 hypothetical protein [Planctomycetaceae bacterium]MBT6486350.1 hypothetical protein [Planctomycetaceae bacterium]MBT6494478.1 hypothetical protein [Planctomycetaceae bacterium]
MSEPQFYRLEAPRYESGYEDTYINGHASHRHSLPGLDCPDCTPWSGGRLLPFECPEEFRKHENIKERWPIPTDAHRELCDQILAALHQAGHAIESLGPGDTFLPAVLDIPSCPEFDFLWSTLGSAIVSERIKTAFESAGLTGIQFVPICLQRVGKAYATDPPPTPSTGEPEDMINEVEEFLMHSEVDPYFQMIITANSATPPGAEITSVCDTCGRESYDKAKRQLVMQPEMWQGHDVFFLATTLYILITPAVRELLEELEATNVEMRPI